MEVVKVSKNFKTLIAPIATMDIVILFSPDFWKMTASHLEIDLSHTIKNSIFSYFARCRRWKKRIIIDVADVNTIMFF